MKAYSTYQVNESPDGESITISTTMYGTEEEIAFMKKNCEETIGPGLLHEYTSPLSSQFQCLGEHKVVPDLLKGWRYE